MLLLCMEPGRVNIKRSVCFFGLHLLGTVIVAIHDKEEGTVREVVYWHSECFHCSPGRAKPAELAFSYSGAQHLSRTTETPAGRVP